MARCRANMTKVVKVSRTVEVSEKVRDVLCGQVSARAELLPEGAQTHRRCRRSIGF